MAIITPIIDPARIENGTVFGGPEEIRRHVPQRYEMEQLSGIFLFDPDEGIVVGYRDVSADEFWSRGHIPGRPIFPGVLIIEAAGQLCLYYYRKVMPENGRFLGFARLENVSFRGAVYPGDRLIIAAKKEEIKWRRATFQTQAFVRNKLVFQCKVIGMPV